MRVAMVCLGNICRSPMAAAIAGSMVEREGLAESVSVESFGTAGYHVGGSADRRATEALKRHGWPDGGHCARMITSADLADLDLVLVADRENLADVLGLATDDEQRQKVKLLRSFDPASSPADQEVPDPWFGDATDFDHAVALIEAACRGLVEHLASARR